jgi:exonuclease III
MMKTISWNIRGLNGRSKQRILQDCIRTEHPDILLLQETKCAGHEAESILRSCWKDGESIYLDSGGASGGLAILWNPQTVSLLHPFSTRYTLTAQFKSLVSSKEGAITNVYGPQTNQDKENFLHSLQLIQTLLCTPHWIIGGDFNIILTLEEKCGGLKRLDQDSGRFKTLIEQLNLVDMETRNGIFTWSNRRTGNQHVACRLDRFLVTDALLESDQAMEANIMPKAGSDHWPIEFCLDTGRPSRPKPFRFEKFWLTHPNFQQLAQDWWDQAEISHGTHMYKFQQRLKNFKTLLKRWNKNTFGDIFLRKRETETQLENLQRTFIAGERTPSLAQEEEKLLEELKTCREQEEVLWRQKSRVQWLKEGERNTKFFHKAMTHRRYINRISQLEDDQGTPIKDHDQIADALNSFYQDLLTETNTNREEAIEKVTRHIPRIINTDHNSALLRPITQTEVDHAVENMPPGKAPGPDGFTTDFFHHCWDMVKEEVWQVVEESRTSGQVLPALNATFITLIPKEERVTHPKQFRPISLCNVIYKIITKVIANRLKPILPLIISKEQSGYVEGRQIMDSVILANEVVHSLKTSNTPGMLIKLDLSKAFDRLSWQYMRAVLDSFGFSKEWVDWILALTSSPFFSILVNGSPSRPFPSSRGIRQGDPLSPFLFVIMAEGLGRYLKAAVSDGSLSGIPLHNLHPAPSHSQFVDDTLLMITPTVRDATKLNSILSDFSAASGMLLNLDKSKLFFFNTPVPVQVHLSTFLGIARSSLPSTYLGIPLSEESSKTISWDSLLLSIANRLNNWTFRPLNIAARLVLLKSVLQALPTYLFTALAAPASVIKAIRRLQRNFLWQGHNSNKKWALVGWEKICKPKNCGGLGIRDPGKMNKIMGAKIWWRWLQNPQELWARLWKHKYAPATHQNQLVRFNEQMPGSNIWTTAWRNRPLIQQHAFWEIRNGESALFWKDSWQQLPPLEDMVSLQPIKLILQQSIHNTVKDFWLPAPERQPWRQWKNNAIDLQIRENLDLKPWQECMHSRKIPAREGSDILRWGHTTSGTFSVKEAYHLQGHTSSQGHDSIWSKVWQPFIWPKISFFLWLTVQNRILTWDNLLKRGFTGPSRCALCMQAEETMEHLLNTCHFSQQIWDWGAQSMRRSQRDRSSIRETLVNWDIVSFQNPILQRIWQLLPGFILWAIWKERNQRIFHSTSSPPLTTWERVTRCIKETILSSSGLQDDMQGKPEEKSILDGWNLPTIIQAQGKTIHRQASSPTSWSPPPPGFLKLNFDGASRGNPGPAGLGAVLRNHWGKITHLIAGFLGDTTNAPYRVTAGVREPPGCDLRRGLNEDNPPLNACTTDAGLP